MCTIISLASQLRALTPASQGRHPPHGLSATGSRRQSTHGASFDVSPSTHPFHPSYSAFSIPACLQAHSVVYHSTIAFHAPIYFPFHVPSRPSSTNLPTTTTTTAISRLRYLVSRCFLYVFHVCCSDPRRCIYSSRFSSILGIPSLSPRFTLFAVYP